LSILKPRSRRFGRLELAANQATHTPLLYEPHIVILVASTSEEEALAHARIVEDVRSSKAEPQSVEVVDLRSQRPE
jgi:putative heme iron utilization protein